MQSSRPWTTLSIFRAVDDTAVVRKVRLRILGLF
ncbi:hypothetical protein [Sporisorium scitamineum]|uniref:Uncharacterized protein n=1 Tax=Sporisorium scitamineum TaxID=49012 RepID=A0A0F7S9P2_9BASI|nr:hypothetical protein [Sporisorium scitamineum]